MKRTLWRAGQFFEASFGESASTRYMGLAHNLKTSAFRVRSCFDTDGAAIQRSNPRRNTPQYAMHERAMPQRANGDSPGQRPENERPTQTTKPHRVLTQPLDELVTISGGGTPSLWFGRMQSDRLRLPATISLPCLHSMESRQRWIQVFRRLHSSNSACRLGQARCILPTS